MIRRRSRSSRRIVPTKRSVIASPVARARPPRGLDDHDVDGGGDRVGGGGELRVAVADRSPRWSPAPTSARRACWCRPSPERADDPLRITQTDRRGPLPRTRSPAAGTPHPLVGGGGGDPGTPRGPGARVASQCLPLYKRPPGLPDDAC